MTKKTIIDSDDELDDTNEEKNEHEADEISKFHIMTMQVEWTVVKDVDRFTPSIEVENINSFSSTVTLANKLTNEIIQR